jgi:phage I-like protein
VNAPLLARASFAAPETAADEFMWMPSGRHPINAFQDSRPVSFTVLVDRVAADAIQQQFQAVSARTGQKVYFDFDHDDKPASFWPESFSWREGSGIWCKGEWSEAGLKAITGKTYRGFSPVFHVDSTRKDPARILFNPEAALNMGGLVNNPAFKKNLPLWAKHAGQPSSANKNTSHTMQKSKAELEAEIQQVNTDLTDLKGRTVTPEVEEAITAKNSDLELLTAQLEAVSARQDAANAEHELSVIRAADAQKAVAEAIGRGVFGPKDSEMMGFWTKEITETPSKAAVLAKMPGRITLGRPTPTGRIEAKDGGAIVGRVQIVRADMRNVLQNMGTICARQAPNGGMRYEERRPVAKEFAAIYAQEILPRLNEGDDIPLIQAGAILGVNTLGSLASTLVATRTLELLTLKFPLLQSILTDFSDQIVSYLDTLKSRFIGIPTVQTFNTTTGWPTDSDVTTTDVSITYNQFKGVPIKFLGHEIAGTVRRLFDEIAPAQAYALGKNIVDYIYTLITAANFTATPISAGLGTFGRATVIDIGGGLDDAANPDTGRFLLLNRPYFSGLSKDAALIQLDTFQKAMMIQKGLENSSLQQVEGFEVIKAVNLPATVIGAKVLKGFGGTRSAIALAARLSADYVNAIPGAGNGNLTVVTTPGGFSANLVQFVSHTAATANQRLEVIYGASPGQGAAGQILTD